MNFFQRLKRYLFGVILGIILSIIFFQDKATLLTSWLPGNRVKVMLAETKWVEDSTATCLYRCVGMQEGDLKKEILEGEVLFKESQTKKEPKVYVTKMLEKKFWFQVNDTLISFIKCSECECL